VLELLQSSALANTVAQSQMLSAGLSALHLVGFTIVMGCGVVSSLRLLGALFGDQPAADVIYPASRALGIGLFINVTTGFLMFMPRAQNAVASPFFRAKLALIVAAALMHLVLQRRLATSVSWPRAVVRASGALGLILWIGVALAASAFILLE
jgi:hypothetical protein